MARRLVVITGASSGIGAAFARVFAQKGWDLALVARREDRLNDLAEEMKAQFRVNSLVIAADLSKASAPQEIVKAVADAGRQIDGLVNNAGAGQPGEFADTKWTDQKRFLQLMLHSYLELIHLTFPGMRERGFGRIINVSSVSALLPPSPGHTKYSGTIYPDQERADQSVRGAAARRAGPPCPCQRRRARLYDERVSRRQRRTRQRIEPAILLVLDR